MASRSIETDRARVDAGHRALAPVEWAEGEADRAADEWGLCLSGGGYRAMLFHLGSLWRLNEAGVLPTLARISSVSGGSITAGLLGWRWARLTFDAGGVATNFGTEIVGPMRRLASIGIDVGAVMRGLLGPGSIADQVAARYRKHLFSDPVVGTRQPTLQDLPDTPRFVINASNLQSGNLWRFSKPYMADWNVGMVMNPTVELAVAVAASSAFPPFLSPLDLRVAIDAYEPPTGNEDEPELTSSRFRARVRLSDGGVYDNLGLETAYKRCRHLLVSDGGGKVGPQARAKKDWLRMMLRVGGVVDNQVRSLRKRQLVGAFQMGLRMGAYWSLRSEPADFPAPNPLLPSPAQIARARAVPTRLAALHDETQMSLINWGYASCDLAYRAYVDRSAAPPTQLPFPA